MKKAETLEQGCVKACSNLYGRFLNGFLLGVKQSVEEKGQIRETVEKTKDMLNYIFSLVTDGAIETERLKSDLRYFEDAVHDIPDNAEWSKYLRRRTKELIREIESRARQSIAA